MTGPRRTSRHRVTFFPAWHADPHLDDLGRALAADGWTANSVGPRGLARTLISAIGGRRTVRLHWYDAGAVAAPVSAPAAA